MRSTGAAATFRTGNEDLPRLAPGQQTAGDEIDSKTLLPHGMGQMSGAQSRVAHQHEMRVRLRQRVIGPDSRHRVGEQLLGVHPSGAGGMASLELTHGSHVDENPTLRQGGQCGGHVDTVGGHAVIGEEIAQSHG